MHKKFIVTILLIGIATAGYAQESPWLVQPQDKTIEGLVHRWAAQAGRQVRWQVPDREITNAEDFNRVARLEKAASLPDAISRVIATVNNALLGNLDEPGSTLLFGCYFASGNVAAVVRAAGSTECFEPF